MVGDNVVLFCILKIYAQYWGQIINKKHQLKLFLLFFKASITFLKSMKLLLKKKNYSHIYEKKYKKD